jgi:acyl carrier protein
MGQHTPMASRDYQSEVIDILADERGLPAERLQLSDRLRQDLGMDGDDAVDFFNGLHERFGTDLTHLHERWSEHFGPEGFSCWTGLVIMPAAVMGGVIAAVAGLSTFWGVAVTVALLAAWLWVMRRWGPSDKMVPVTVQEVVAAVEAGAWPRQPHA